MKKCLQTIAGRPVFHKMPGLKIIPGNLLYLGKFLFFREKISRQSHTLFISQHFCHYLS